MYATAASVVFHVPFFREVGYSLPVRRLQDVYH